MASDQHSSMDFADIRFALGAGHRGNLDGKMRQEAEAALLRIKEQFEDVTDAARVVCREYYQDNPFYGYAIEALDRIVNDSSPASRPDRSAE